MATAPLFNHQAKKLKNITLPKTLFAAPVNQVLMAQAVRVYLANQRQATAKTQTRSEVSRTKRKWYKQKGTGRARHGARSAPIIVGGGVAHGPTGKQNYHLSLPRKMRQRSLASALSLKAQQKQVQVITGLDKLPHKTKAAAQLLQKLKLDQSKVCLVLDRKHEALVRLFANLPNVTIRYANLLNTYTVLQPETLLVYQPALDQMKDHFRTLAAVSKPNAGKSTNKSARSKNKK